MRAIKNIPVYIINAFVDNDRGGNPAAVVLEADAYSAGEKQAIAKMIGLSETAFVLGSDVAEFRLEFFTPTRQIAHCGHATIATFSFLSQKGMVGQRSSKETIDGKRDIFIRDNMAFMEQLAPEYRDVPAFEIRIKAALGLKDVDVPAFAPIRLVSTGNAFVIVPVANVDVLSSIVPDLNLIAAISEELDLVGFYVFAIGTSRPGRHASTRMFAPRYGISEEAGTGMAAGPLACYLYEVMGMKISTFYIEQGHFMERPSPSLLQVGLQLVGDKINSLLVGGKGMLVDAFKMNLP
ncbi:PhzF family phenazine biosynthesis protein [Filimonas zeae]|uniref:Phenazine biosynthesis protein PhzF n=1 Tax=Filimonas zeae TaxID=1737353 RepID=A0A917IR27_9BACT|nr:PhzF family phenazine biosynthesis protein [Filimonas zeae]MDR6338131.1 PhzF family phenazine biosynthesis protein [Filimonas zeae]GGH61871.1 phenazine biosynthesis protein PhzF [Filimonas zeae]